MSPQKDTQEKPQADPRAESQVEPSECSYRAERLCPERWRCVGAHLPKPGDAHGSRSPLERGGGAGRFLPDLAGVLLSVGSSSPSF